MVEHNQKFQMRRHSCQSMDNKTDGTLGSVIQIQITIRIGGRIILSDMEQNIKVEIDPFFAERKQKQNY